MNEAHIIAINGSHITDFDTFHSEFKRILDFPDFYGANMNAWIDCMRDIHEDTGMTNLLLDQSQPLILEISDAEIIPEEVLNALASCTAYVNKYLHENNFAPIYLLLN